MGKEKKLTAKEKQAKFNREAEAAEEDWEELQAVEFKFDKPGATIQGILLDAKETRKGGVAYTIQTQMETMYFFGGKQIDSLLPDKIGYEIQVKFLGSLDTGQQSPMKTFSVKFRKPKRVQIIDKTEDDVPF